MNTAAKDLFLPIAEGARKSGQFVIVKKQINVRFSCVCPVIDHQFCCNSYLDNDEIHDQ